MSLHSSLNSLINFYIQKIQLTLNEGNQQITLINQQVEEIEIQLATETSHRNIINLMKESNMILVDCYMLTYEQSILMEKLNTLFSMMNSFNSKIKHQSIHTNDQQLILEEMSDYFRDKQMDLHYMTIQKYIVKQQSA